MANILITGGAGYIGSHAVKKFLEEGHEVAVIDNLTTGYKQAIEALQSIGKLTFHELDLQDYPKVLEVFKSTPFDTVLHFAASALVNESMEKPSLYFRNNVVGALNLLDAMKETKTSNLIFSSTCATYGETQYVPVDEKHPQNPTNPYGESKLMVEKIIKWFGQLHDQRYVILRYFNLCGTDPDTIVGDSMKPSARLMQNAVRGALGIEPFKLTCPTVDTPDGTPIRDYIDVNDLIDAHYKAFSYLTDGKDSDIFNLGTGTGHTVLEIVQAVEQVLGVDIDRTKGEERKGEYAKIYASYDKARKILGWEPKRTLQDSVLSLKKWYEAHPSGWDY